jgi:hypothetical protein
MAKKKFWRGRGAGLSIVLKYFFSPFQAVQTAGGGDNISAAGLVMQL